jgi:hypothetical protein
MKWGSKKNAASPPEPDGQSDNTRQNIYELLIYGADSFR